MHELIHAMTAHAIANNIRGTRDVTAQLMSALRSQLGDKLAGLSENIQYAMREGPEEFVGVGLQDQEMRDMLASLRVPLRLRAKIRAMGRGREMPTFWDAFVAVIQNAVGIFTHGRHGASYLDQLLRAFPHMAMTAAEQRESAEALDAGNEYFGAPFNAAALKAQGQRLMQAKGQDWSQLGRHALNRAWRNVETLNKNVADQFFGGDLDNFFNDISDELLSQQRRIEEKMKPGDQMDSDILRWMQVDPATRRDEVGRAHALFVNASIDRVDMRKTLQQNTWIRHDAFHPTRRKRSKPTWKHEADTARRSMYDRYKAEWDTLPTELQDLISKRVDHMKATMLEYETELVRSWIAKLTTKDNNPVVLPPGVDIEEAVRQTLADTMTDELIAALGDNAATVQAIGRFGSRDMMYAPAFRGGKFFISGRRKIATPTVSHGRVVFDQTAFDDRGVFRFVFNNKRDAIDYANGMGTSGDERVLNVKRKWINPLTGAFVSPAEKILDANNNVLFPQEIYYVTMQDRFMAMSDSPSELQTQLDEMKASGEYDPNHLSNSPMLLEEHRNFTSTMPLAMQTMMHNIDSQSGPSVEEKGIAKAMILNSFIQTQQGNRITKKMMRRKGVVGYETGATEMFRSFNTNNQMMARHIVALTRWPAIQKAQQYGKAFLDAMNNLDRAKNLAKLNARDRALITRGYGKLDAGAATRLSEDVREINARIKKTAEADGGKMRGEAGWNAFMSAVTLNYLAKPAYYAIQASAFILQTFPHMASVISGVEGGAGHMRAYRYLSHGLSDANALSRLKMGFKEGASELGHMLGGFKPRPGWATEGRPFRSIHDYFAEQMAELGRAGVQYPEAKKMALQRAYDLGHYGQAGLDQPNLRMNMVNPGLPAKFFRAMEASTRVFRAFAEGIETMNRAAPIFGYVQFYKDKGYSDEQAARLAVNNMVKEQTSYGKHNWPNWMSSIPLVTAAMMFKKFAMEQANIFYTSLARSVMPGTDWDTRRAALVHLGTMTGVLALFGGLAGNPLWEPIRLLMYLFGLSDNWERTKTAGQNMLADWIGDKPAEVVMHGAPRLAGIDISNRVSLDNLLFYEQPKEMSQEQWLKVIGQMFGGAPASMGFDAVGNLYQVFDGDESWPKWLSQMPAPGIVKDMFKVADLVTNGPTTATGVKTGDPSGPLAAVANLFGIKTAAQSRVFETGSAAKQREEKAVGAERSALVRRIVNQGYTGGNVKAMRDWNRSHKGKERITAKTITTAKKRRRKTEREIEKENE